MTTDDPRGTGDQRGKDRVSWGRPVKLRYRRFQDFLREVSTNISTGGMFIATKRPRPPGSQFDFELALEDGFTLVKGRGEVVWVRGGDQGIDQPPGMGIRFLELKGASRRLIAKMVEKRESEEAGSDGERTVEQGLAANGEATAPLSLPALTRLAEKGPAPAAAEAETEELETAAGVAQRARRPDLLRLLALILASALVGALVVVLFNLTWVRPKIRELEDRVAELAGREERERLRAVSLEDGVDPEASGEAASGADRNPLATVKAWARAWSEKRTDDYLGFYADDFEPRGDLSRESWETLRRTRIARHSEIDVQVLLAEVQEIRQGEAVVSFVQAYRSDTYEDRVRKKLTLVRENDDWKISAEQVIPAVPD